MIARTGAGEFGEKGKMVYGETEKAKAEREGKAAAQESIRKVNSPMLSDEQIEQMVDEVRFRLGWQTYETSPYRRGIKAGAVAEAQALIKYLLDGLGEYHHVPEAGRGICYCLYEGVIEQLKREVGLE